MKRHILVLVALIVLIRTSVVSMPAVNSKRSLSPAAREQLLRQWVQILASINKGRTRS